MFSSITVFAQNCKLKKILRGQIFLVVFEFTYTYTVIFYTAQGLGLAKIVN